MSQSDSYGEFTTKGCRINEDNKFIEYLLEQRSTGIFIFDLIKVGFVLQNIKRMLSTSPGLHEPNDLIRVKFKEMRREVNYLITS